MDHENLTPAPVAEKEKRSRHRLTKQAPKSTASSYNSTSAASTPRDSKLSSQTSDRAHFLHSELPTISTSNSDALQKSTHQLIGPAFNADDLISQLDSTSYKTAARYNAPSPAATPVSASLAPSNPSPSTRPNLTHASTLDERLLSPGLRTSGGQIKLGGAMDRITPPRSETSSSGTKSPRQRYSDEAKPDGSSRKKSLFANFLNGVKGPPRRPTISSPVNPTHVHHVSFDQDTGTLTVCSAYLYTL